MAQQTAVEYLFEQLWETPKDKFTWHSILNKAKEIEQQQIIDAYEVSHISMMTSEQYYNENYKNK